MSSHTSETFVGAEEKAFANPIKDPEQASADLSLESDHHARGKESVPSTVDTYEVRLESAEDPKNMSLARKWFILAIICTGTLCSTCASSMVRSHD